MTTEEYEYFRKKAIESQGRENPLMIATQSTPDGPVKRLVYVFPLTEDSLGHFYQVAKGQSGRTLKVPLQDYMGLTEASESDLPTDNNPSTLPHKD